ncbi:MAG: hypothetical protein HN390_15040 [Anaerolineae bacterium]|jgi:hypothetical protein|nr:hypothetical protein [Anaerolineae bacterium]MBT7190417.1 hypothetical protein [Anaerolineae bacterium]MBT7991073.1 hypothetical protein [Anaerolineae bacterium]
MELINLFGSIFSIVFILWPLAIGGAFSKGGVREARWAWIVLFIGWLFARVVEPLPSFLIPEPYNKYLFFGVGLVLCLLKLFHDNRDGL